MTDPLGKGLNELLESATSNCKVRGEGIVDRADKTCRLIVLWLQELRSTEATGTADCMIEGTASAIREGIACVALGLVRPALNSLRLQMDLMLGWLYFKDHPVEWQRVQDSGEGFRLKTELFKYLAETMPRFPKRFGILRDIRTRKTEDPYRLLSAHIHGQSGIVLPNVCVPKDIVAAPKMQDEFLDLQFECSEYVGDVLWSVYADQWARLPGEVREALDARFKTKAQRATFFE